MPLSKPIDLRSDTFTQPSDEMREVLAKAEVGDDVFCEDPSINELQAYTCEITGKEAALFVPSGTLGNLLAVFVGCDRGSELILHEESHIIGHEMAGCAVVAGVLPRTISSSDGTFTPKDIENRLSSGEYFTSKSTMVAIENSHNNRGGTCWSLEQVQKIYEMTQEKNLHLHTDGARLLNVVATGRGTFRDYCDNTDSLMFCLSKGLGAPVGSLLCGSRSFIEEAINVRKMLGGGMHQGGLLASAGLWALKNNQEQLAIDNRHAEIIAEALSECEWANFDRKSVQTNMVYFGSHRHSGVELQNLLEERGVLSFALDAQSVRVVTSSLVGKSEIEKVCEILKKLS